MRNPGNPSLSVDIDCEYDYNQNASCVENDSYTVETNVGTSVVNDSFEPDTRNIMSYSRQTCVEYLTDGQNERMREICNPNSDMYNVLVQTTGMKPSIHVVTNECIQNVVTLSISQNHASTVYDSWEWKRNGSSNFVVNSGTTSGTGIVGNINVNETDLANYTLTLSNPNCLQIIGIDLTIADIGIQGTYIIDGYERWETSLTDQTISINGHILIKEGGFLDVESGANIEFINSDGDIIVENGGRMEGSGVNFRASNCVTNNTWKGMQVIGSPEINHDDPNNNPGTIVLSGGSVEDAEIGVLVAYHNNNSEVNQLFYYISGYYPNGTPIVTVVLESDMGPMIGGGLISFNNVDFDNNHQAIVMGQTLHTTDNRSEITNCVFTNSAAFPNNNPPYDLPYVHIELRQLSTPPKIVSNTFQTTQTSGLIGKQKGTGIETVESAYRVGSDCSGNTFINVYQGVYSTSLGAALPQSISNNLFRGVNKGVTLNNTNFVEVAYNRFENIPEGTASNDISHGLLLNSAAMSSILENYFGTTSAPITFKRGLVIKNSNYAIEEDDITTTPFPPNVLSGLDFYINSNIFDGEFNAATQFEQDNTELGFTINCQHYTNSNSLDWYLHSDCDMAQVGVCLEEDADLAYRGSWNTGPAHVWDVSGTLMQINYRNHKPEVVNNPSIAQSCGFDRECVQILCGGKVAPHSPTAPITPEKERRYLVQNIQYKLATGDYVGVVNDLEQRQEVWSDKVLVANYLQKADKTKANQTLNRIPSNTIANTNFKDMLLSILQYQLLANESMIRYHAGDLSLNPRTNVLAESILGTYLDEEYTRNAAPLVANSSKRASSLPIKTWLQLLPNPAKDQLSIQWIEQPSEDELTLTIFNGMGQEVKNYNWIVEHQRTNVALEGLESGVYYIQIQGVETIYGFEKVILIK